MLEGTYFWEQGCHLRHCHVYPLGAWYIAAKRRDGLFIRKDSSISLISGYYSKNN